VPAKRPREIAVRILGEWKRGDRTADALLAEALPRLSGPDRGLCQELVLGVIRRQATLDWLIEQKTNGRRQQPLIQILLRLGLYQIFYLDRIPDHAVVNETVNLARRHDLASQGGFLNAVLRNCLRERDDWRARLDELHKRQPALGFSHPQWLVQRWQDRWENFEALLDWNNQPAPVYARRNTLRATAAELEAQWKTEGVRAEAANLPWLSPGLMYRLETEGAPAALPSFAEGKFYITDPSTMAAVQELDPQPGENILDLCAAPGGKSTAIAQLMNDEGSVLAIDIDEARLGRLRENIERLGITCIQPKPLRGIDLKIAGPFDRILVDAPCSNTGVMRRRVEVRWRLHPRDLPTLARAQLDLLQRAAARLKPDGVLIYSTCSLEAEENEDVVAAFLKKRADFKQERARTITPMNDGVDGAFVSRLRRRPRVSASA
jgi:16S rRNA (cytosine967-C5)-methyltransferase